MEVFVHYTALIQWGGDDVDVHLFVCLYVAVRMHVLVQRRFLYP